MLALVVAMTIIIVVLIAIATIAFVWVGAKFSGEKTNRHYPTEYVVLSKINKVGLSLS